MFRLANTTETTPMNNANATPAPAQTYAARRNDIARLLDVLQMELEKHDQRFAAAPTNWGLVGNLEKVRADLVGVAAFLGNMDPQDVERFLNDAE